MGLYQFKLPDLGEGAAEAEIVAWRVAEGDLIDEDAPLVDVMTDKATVEITSPVRGKVLRLHAGVGDQAAVGSVLVELEVEGEEAEEVEQAIETVREAPAAEVAAPETPAPETAVQPTEEAPVPPAGHAAEAAPAVRARARALGVDLQSVRGSGPDGRVTHADLDALRPSGSASAPREDVEEVKVIGLRRRIAEKMIEAKRRIPHFGYVEEVDVTELEAARTALNAEFGEARGRLTVLPLLMRAVVKAAAEFPGMNAHYDDEAGIVRRFGAVHIGIATQTDNGLMVPVVRHAETLDLWASAREVARLAAAARDGSAAREELSGSTITITSLGPLGGVSHFPVINHPEVAILGPNKIAERPAVVAGQIQVRKLMNVSSAFDHRVVDGHDAAQFIQAIRRLLERPALLLVD